MRLRPETILRRQVELQVGVRYQTELLGLRTELARVQGELAEERLKTFGTCACPADVPPCGCSWCKLAKEAFTYCEGARPAAALRGDGCSKSGLH